MCMYICVYVRVCVCVYISISINPRLTSRLHRALEAARSIREASERAGPSAESFYTCVVLQ